jgi:hypothetical protein
VSVSYRIDQERHTLFIRATGVLRDEDLGLLWRAIVKDPDMKPDFDELADLTGVTTSQLSTRFVWDLTEWLKKVGAQRARRGKMATVATKDVLYGLAQMSAALSEGYPAEFRTFRSLSAARDWLGLSAEGSEADAHWNEIRS